ncbi:MAG TPA: branched-chain amino acid ABC transporter ATP-binding protein [Ignavibacteriales bacterium]|nr:branched-chain amino acid ABC transporter ATP-binding protein [Ignavibacteriales bacterium]
MLIAEHITTGYGKKQVLTDVSFEVKQREIVLLIGSNGSGKTTLLKTIYGLLKTWPVSAEAPAGKNNGKIYFSGEDITGLPAHRLLKKGLLYIPQKNNCFEDLSVQANLEMAGLIIPDSSLLKQRIKNAYIIFPMLKALAKRTPMKMSGGERQHLAMAMAMLHQPKMILMDEPVIGLDHRAMQIVFDSIKKLNNLGVTFLIVEHRVRETYQIANRIISLKFGAVFSIEEVNDNFNINKLNTVFI